jgi:hypothetical protein
VASLIGWTATGALTAASGAVRVVAWSRGGAALDKKVQWYEVFSEDGGAPPYLLLLWCDFDGLFEVYDPLEKQVCYTCSSYEDALIWLSEDEFSLVEGRVAEDWLTAPRT